MASARVTGSQGLQPRTSLEGTGLTTFLAGQDSKTLFCLCYHPVHHMICPDNSAWAFLSTKPLCLASFLPTITRDGYHWLCFADEEASSERKT